MKLTPAQSAELVSLVAHETRRARVTITGGSMRPLLRAGMVVEVEPLSCAPRAGDILLFRSRTGLVAHRFLRAEHTRSAPDGAAFITAGDAHPDRPEVVPADLVVGRVSAVWASAAPNARRVDGALYRRLGRLIARTRRQRSALVKLRRYLEVLFADPARIAPPAAFAALAEATREFEQLRYGEGVDLLRSVPLGAAIEMARRHHLSGLFSHWLDDASQAGVAVPSELSDTFRRIRWTNALQAGRVLSCVRDVRDRFVAAGIPHIVLKGGARLASDEPGADLQFSGDLDVLVPAALVETALSTLRGAGFREITDEPARARYAALHHHRGALLPPDVDVPVEVHFALAPPLLVSQRLDYAALAPYTLLARGPVGEVRVLDRVATAVHLAYHARDLHVWRDIVLLSRLLRDFNEAERSRFAAYVKREKRDALRLQGAVAAADAVALNPSAPSRAVQRYLAWATLREDLPDAIAHVDVMEAVAGRCLVPELRFDHAPDVRTWLRGWIRNLALLPAVARIERWRAKKEARR
jgi:hypothetical protein